MGMIRLSKEMEHIDAIEKSVCMCEKYKHVCLDIQ